MSSSDIDDSNQIAAINGKGIHFAYENDGMENPIVTNFDIMVNTGEVVCLFGPNGCGKSTLLRLCAGLLRSKTGNIEIFGQSPIEIKIGYIPQAFGESLFPWLTNLDNIAFPLYMNAMTKKAAREKAEETALKLSISIPLKRHPNEVSIGQQQLICLARALILEPTVLIADEPFSALDFQTRRDMQDVFHRVLDPANKIAALIVSHQIEDAVYMADRVVVTSPVPLRQVDIFDIPFNRPRSQDFKKSNSYFNLTNTVTESFVKARCQ